MQFLIDKISRLNIGWNERALDEGDFDALCKRFGITLQEMPLTTAGFYYRLLGRDFFADGQLVIDDILPKYLPILIKNREDIGKILAK